MQLLSFMCLLWLVPTILARQCGFPGKPEKGAVDPHKSVYNEGERVTYTCDRGSYYFKHDSPFDNEASRTCQDTGLWNGAIPDCAYDDLLFNSITSGAYSYITDPWDGTCVTVVLLDQARIRASFKRSYTGPIQILVGLSEQSGATATVTVDYTNCSPLISTPRVSEFSSICNITKKDGDHHVELVLAPTRAINSYMTIFCEKKQVIEIGCGVPDCPAYGTVYRTSSNIARYECDEGYEILGEPQRECGWSYSHKKLFWFGTAPVCAPIKNNLPTVPNECPDCPTKQSPDVKMKSVQCFPEFTLGAENRMADCNCLTNWTWKFNFSLPTTNEEMRESPILNTSTTLSLVIIAVIATIFNILYCLVRYIRKTLKPWARPRLENDQRIHQKKDVRVEPEVLLLKSPSRDGRNLPVNEGLYSRTEQNSYSMNEEYTYDDIEVLGVFSTAQTNEEPEALPLNNLPRDGRNLPANNGWCSTYEQNTYPINEEHIYAEVDELAVFSTAQTTAAEHLYKNEEPCTGANESVKANSNHAKIPIRQHSSFTDTYGVCTHLASLFLRTRNLSPKSESGQLQSNGPAVPSPRKAKKKSDHSVPSYMNVPKITSKPT